MFINQFGAHKGHERYQIKEKNVFLTIEHENYIKLGKSIYHLNITHITPLLGESSKLSGIINACICYILLYS